MWLAEPNGARQIRDFIEISRFNYSQNAKHGEQEGSYSELSTSPEADLSPRRRTCRVVFDPPQKIFDGLPGYGQVVDDSASFFVMDAMVDGGNGSVTLINQVEGWWLELGPHVAYELPDY